MQVLANLQTLEVEVEVDGSLHDLLQVPLLNLGATEEDKFDGIQLSGVEKEPQHRYGRQPLGAFS